MFSIYNRIIVGRTGEQRNVGAMTGQSATDACALDGATVSTAIVAFNDQNPTEVAVNLQSDLTATSAATGGPYLSSWPSNLPHYAFQIDPSTGSLEYSDGVIFDAGTGAYAADIAGQLTSPSVDPDDAPGSTNSPWYAYLGPTSCTGAN